MHSSNQNEEVSAYIDDELSVPARRSFEMHLERCTGCRHEVVRLRRLQKRLRDLPPHTVGYDLAPRLRARSLWKPKASKTRHTWRLPLLVPLSSALATVAFGIYLGLVISRPDYAVARASELVLLDPVPACSASISAMVLF